MYSPAGRAFMAQFSPKWTINSTLSRVDQVERACSGPLPAEKRLGGVRRQVDGDEQNLELKLFDTALRELVVLRVEIGYFF
jgi:hypothetical protein